MTAAEIIAIIQALEPLGKEIYDLIQNAKNAQAESHAQIATDFMAAKAKLDAATSTLPAQVQSDNDAVDAEIEALK